MLNAFRHHGLYRIPDHRILVTRPSDVLNAFRHHGLYRLYAGGSGVYAQIVLNAFRHHGLYRTGIGNPFGVLKQCSTPFGITDYIGTHGYQGEPDYVLVLNAFRHHGLYRSHSDDARYLQLFWCSTPFGITDYIGPTWARKKRSKPCGAQRLSASRIISVGWLGAAVDPNHSCSTPFGITDYIGRLAGRPAAST